MALNNDVEQWIDKMNCNNTNPFLAELECSFIFCDSQ